MAEVLITYCTTRLAILKWLQILCSTITFVFLIEGREQWGAYTLIFFADLVLAIVTLFTLIAYFLRVHLQNPQKFPWVTFEIVFNLIAMILSIVFTGLLIYDTAKMFNNSFYHHRFAPPRNIGNDGWRHRIIIVAVAQALNSLLYCLSLYRTKRANRIGKPESHLVKVKMKRENICVVSVKEHWEIRSSSLKYIFLVESSAFPHHIAKRFVLHKIKWNRCLLTWSFRDPFHLFASEYDFTLAKNVVKKAIQTWEIESGNLLRLLDVSPKFSLRKDAIDGNKELQRRYIDRSKTIDEHRYNKRSAHIDVFFARFAHGDAESFDGAGGMVAHTAYPVHGLVHFDASEHWSVDGKTDSDQKKYVDLRYVALHEFGHALGLRHSTHNRSVMNPYYSENAVGSLHLSRDDIEGLQELYENCRPIHSPKRHKFRSNVQNSAIDQNLARYRNDRTYLWSLI